MQFLHALPRLAGIAQPEEIRAFEAVLTYCAEQVRRGVDIAELKGMLGPQIALREPVALYDEPSDSLFDAIVDRYLAAPRRDRAAQQRRILRESSEQLDELLEGVAYPRAAVVRNATPNRLYSDRIERYVRGHNVPRMARAIRAFRRDVLINSMRFDPTYRPRDLRDYASRIDDAFFVYDRYLREVVRDRLNTDIRLVGVLHPLPDAAPQHLIDLRDRTADTWRSRHAVVLEGSEGDIAAGLQAEATWAAEGR